jgi:hypothetical protein
MVLIRFAYPGFRYGTRPPIYRGMELRRLGLVLLAALAAGCGRNERAIDKDVRAAGLRFTASVASPDRAWIEAAIAQARPEARALIGDVDGMVTVRTASAPGAPWVGLARQTGEHAYEISFNLAYLDGGRKLDRNVAVLHEFGHIVDFALTPPQLRDQLAASLPPVGACMQPERGDCTAPQERFADTFAKWALRGAVSLAGAGYGVASPASLEDWGAPLARLAIDIEVASRAR